MEQSLIKEIHDLLFELLPLYFEKFGHFFHKADNSEPKCNKNQARTVAILKRHGKITATHLGKKLDLEKGSLTSLIDSLEEMQMVVREADPSDRRKNLISLTGKGEEYFAQRARSYEEYLHQLLNSRPAAEVEEFKENLQYIIEFAKKL